MWQLQLLCYTSPMPLVESTFKPSAIVRNATLQTVLPSIARRTAMQPFFREILELADGDMLELDWLRSNQTTLAVINHGLEGSTKSSYVRGMAHALQLAGFDVLAWNMRGCGSARNRLATWYHSGQSDDLRAVLAYAHSKHIGPIVLIGFSVGGNILLKYLGEERRSISPRIKAAVAISVPMDLRGSADVLAKPSNALYMRYLLKPLRSRMIEKAARFPELFNLSGLSEMRTFREFDARFTAPLHGFDSVDHYWDSCSSKHYLAGISIPTLAVSALDDPFLSPECFPSEEARSSRSLYLETPQHGGHVGFISSLNLRTTWIEERTVQFLTNPL